MYYAVTACLIPESAADFLRKLTDNSIENQKPDGHEIVESMKRARIDSEGVIRWSEVCYCPTPLKHERETVYDHFLKDIETEEVSEYLNFGGEPLMEYLAKTDDKLQ